MDEDWPDFILADYGVVDGAAFREDVVNLAARILSDDRPIDGVREMAGRPGALPYAERVASEAASWVAKYCVAADDADLPATTLRLATYLQHARSALRE